MISSLTKLDTSSVVGGMGGGEASVETNYGRVLLLHFVCRASLPMGCSLRVTSSQLWAPGTLSHISDPTDAKAVSVKTVDVALPNNLTDGEVDAENPMNGGVVDPSGAYAYASSVEMVTCPDTYPLWRTRTPVVVILRHHHGIVQHHRYRYLVICPGAEHFRLVGVNSSLSNSLTNKGGLSPTSRQSSMIEDDSDMEGTEGMGVATSSDDYTMEGTSIGTEVMTWEDPFKARYSADVSHISNTSLPSLRRAAISRNLANLPYRTLDIDTVSCQVMSHYRYSDKDRHFIQDSSDFAKDEEFTADGIRIDAWNDPNDYSFRPYLIREAINKENKQKKMRSSSERSLVNLSEGNGGELSGYGSSNTSGMFTNTDTSYDTDELMKEVSISGGVSGGPTSDHVMTTQVSFSDDLKKQFQQGRHVELNSSMVALSPIAKTLPRIKKERIFFVCFHLPVILSRDMYSAHILPYRGWSACWAESLLAATEDSAVVRSLEAHWVGTVSVSSHNPIQTEEDRIAVRTLLATMNCTPLFLDQKAQDAHYLGMCKQVLWPAFHNINLLDLSTSGWIHPNMYHSSEQNNLLDPSRDRSLGDSSKPLVSNPDYENLTESDWDQSRLDGWWGAYELVNSSFADLMATMIRPGDIMWVHDYHLCLLPKILDDKERTLYSGRSVTKKVFFLHIPFPTSQIFRELECGEAILEGMLHADVVGFHAFDHARHFLTASKRILGLSYDSLVGGLIGVQYGRKTVLVTMHNVSIEPKILDAALTLPSVSEGESLLRHKYESRIIISGVDISQRLSGVSLKLLAYEKLLTDYPIWQEKVVLVQKCLIPNSRHSDETNTLRELRFLVRRIKDKFGSKVIEYEEVAGSTLPIDQRLALWKTADVIMATPIREGLSLLPMEFIYTRKAPHAPGVIIWSEFSAVCSILNGALRVNPFDIQMTVTTIDKALTMSSQEREGRRFRDIGFVSSSPSGFWSSQVLHDLHDATEYTSGISDASESDDTTIVGTKFDRKDLITSTSAFLAHEHEVAFSRLDFDAVLRAYKVTYRRVFFLDLNGTIVIKEPPGKYLKREILGTSGNKPPQAVINALLQLCTDERNTVFVVSGDSQENVESAIGNIPGLGLAASNGACFSLPSNRATVSREWKYFDLGVDWDAVKKIVLPILSKYTARTNGSFIKLTHSSIGWSYYSCDPEWGSLQASHLILELEPALRPFDVRFVMIKGIVEIVPRRLNKGIIVKNVLREVAKSIGPAAIDFILCMGDDIHDEKMFTSVLSFIAERENAKFSTPCPPIVNALGVPLNIDSTIPKGGVLSFSTTNKSCYCFTAAVGKKQSHASNYVDDARDVAALLVQLTGGSRDWSLRSKSFDAKE